MKKESKFHIASTRARSHSQLEPKKKRKKTKQREIDIFEWAKKYELETILNEMADRQNNTTDTKESVRENH